MSSAANLTGRVALVTGAGTGIGRAVSLALAAAGAKVGIHYHTSAAEAVQPLAALNGDEAGIVLQADLTDEGAASTLVDRVAGHFGRLDIVVNNAGSPLRSGALVHCLPISPGTHRRVTVPISPPSCLSPKVDPIV